MREQVIELDVRAIGAWKELTRKGSTRQLVGH